MPHDVAKQENKLNGITSWYLKTSAPHWPKGISPENLVKKWLKEYRMLVSPVSCCCYEFEIDLELQGFIFTLGYAAL